MKLLKAIKKQLIFNYNMDLYARKRVKINLKALTWL